MKLIVIENRVGVVSETKEEATQLIELITPKRAYVQKAKSHKKHQFTKACFDCERSFRGNIGLNIHRAKEHGYISPNREYNLKLSEKRRALATGFRQLPVTAGV